MVMTLLLVVECDTIYGGAGNDIFLDFGDSTIYGGEGNDNFNRDDNDPDTSYGSYALILYGEEETILSTIFRM